MSDKKRNVTIWNEYRHELQEPACREIYPDGIHGCIKKFLEAADDTLNIRLAALDEQEQGLPAEILNDTDVLLWWGHMAHQEVSDALVERVRDRVYRGKMGLIIFHSGHQSKVFREVIGTNGNLSWGRDQKEIVWNLLPAHPITAGVPDHFELFEELYCGLSMCRNQMSWYLEVGLRMALSSDRDCVTTAEQAKYSTFSRDMSSAVLFTILASSVSFGIRYIGLHLMRSSIQLRTIALISSIS